MDVAGLLERERELSLLEGAIDRALGGRGAVVVVEGPPGIGKSALLTAACERARAQGLTVLAARGGVLERAYPFGVVTQLLGRRLGLGLGRGDLESGHRPGAGDTLVDPQARRFLVLESLLERVAARAPALVAVDDLQWSDAESLRFVAFAAARADHRALLLVLALRSREPHAHRELFAPLLSDRSVLVLRPEPLSVAAVAQLLNAGGVSRPGEQLAAACHRSTGGNPFLVVELARTLAAGSFSGEDPQAACAVAGLAPEGLGRAVLARLAALSAGAVAVAGALAVLGGRAELELVAQLAGLDVASTSAAADVLADAAVFAPGRPLEFVHSILRQAIYEDMPGAQRTALHGAAARVLSEAPDTSLDQVAAHLLECDPDGQAWVARLLERAARQALERGAPDAACSYLERALREPPAAELELQLLLLLGDARLRASAPEEAIEVLRAALERTHDPVSRARVAARLQPALTYGQRGDLGAGLLAAAIEDLPGEQRELGLELEAQLQMAQLVHLGAARATAGRRPRFSAGTGAGARSEPRAPATRGELLSLAAQASAQTARGAADRAAALARTALAGGRLLSLEGPESPLFYLACYALVHADQLAEAERSLAAAIELAGTKRSVLAAAIAHGLRAEGRYRAGRLDAACADARIALDAIRYGLRFGPRPAAGALVMALTDQGRLVEAQRTLAESGFAGQLPDAATSVWLAHARGRLHATLGRHDLALEDFELCERIEAAFAVNTPVLAPWRSSRALSLAALGRDLDAPALVEEEIERARAFGAPRALGIALTAAGSLHDRLEPLREAVAVLESSEARLEHARALTWLGSALRRRGQRAAARSPLQQALHLAAGCGATALAQRAREELQATGAHPRKILHLGSDALTAAERRVAELAADGLTNRQIATQLTLSVRTVESHLAHAYQKLDITSRRQLAAALAGNGMGRDGAVSETVDGAPERAGPGEEETLSQIDTPPPG